MAREKKTFKSASYFLIQVLIFQLLFLLLICCQHATGMQCIGQRRCQHFKSGQATANQDHSCMCKGGEGLQQATCGIKMRGCRCRPVGPRQAPDPPTKERERL